MLTPQVLEIFLEIAAWTLLVPMALWAVWALWHWALRAVARRSRE